MLDHSWRWFGPDDRITLEEIVQTGAYNIVTALHRVPVGEPWPPEEIRQRRALIEQAGLSWSVVESIPVHEDIKTGSGKCSEYTDHFKQTLVNLGREGIRTVCYNFMPALDWSRTDLKFKSASGAENSLFHYSHFAAIDIHILKRKGAATSYPGDIADQATAFFRGLDHDSVRKLEETFLLGFPGSGERFSLEQVRGRIRAYEGIDRDRFRSNLATFLREVIPVAESSGIRLAIHPDDPPWPLLGLPRVFSNVEDALFITGIVDSPFNGITFCTGSLGASHENDTVEMAQRLATRINFAHLRNVSRDRQRNFREEQFFDGDVDMYRVMKILVQEDMRRAGEDPGHRGIPVRPDHGAQLLGDLKETNYPGYPLYGRMKSLAEIRGLEIGVRNSLNDA
jgi:mannonate dehydratase